MASKETMAPPQKTNDCKEVYDNILTPLTTPKIDEILITGVKFLCPVNFLRKVN